MDKLIVSTHEISTLEKSNVAYVLLKKPKLAFGLSPIPL
jgi:hypothetical protein